MQVAPRTIFRRAIDPNAEDEGDSSQAPPPTMRSLFSAIPARSVPFTPSMRHSKEDDVRPIPIQDSQDTRTRAGSLTSSLARRFHLRKSEIADNELIKTDGWLFKGVAARICDLHLDDVVPSTENVVSRRKIVVLVEYTWLQGPPFPTVYVPVALLMPASGEGNTRIWNKLTPGIQLHPAVHPPPIIDEHTHHQPAFPYEPTIHALQHATSTDASPTTSLRHVDVISDAATLALLFAFVSHPAHHRFRLELSTVPNQASDSATLFLATATPRRLGATDNGNGRYKARLPPWVRHAVTAHACVAPTTPTPTPRLLPFSAGHFRVVRYRMGRVVLVVRAKVDWAVANQTPQPVDDMAVRMSMRGMMPEKYPNTTSTTAHTANSNNNNNNTHRDTLQTTIHPLGVGTAPSNAGMTSVRLPSSSPATIIAAQMPTLWFGRVPFLADGVVVPRSTNTSGGYAFETRETKIFSARDSFARWEAQHQATLQTLAGLLRQLRDLARTIPGGRCVVVGDPGARCLRVLRPAEGGAPPVPEAVMAQVWGGGGGLAEGPTAAYESSSEEEESSELSQLSGTPSCCEEVCALEGAGATASGAAHVLQRSLISRRKVASWLDGANDGYEADSEIEGSGVTAGDSSTPTVSEVRSRHRRGPRHSSLFPGHSSPLLRCMEMEGVTDVDDGMDSSHTEPPHEQRPAARCSMAMEGLEGTMEEKEEEVAYIPPRRPGLLSTTYFCRNEDEESEPDFEDSSGERETSMDETPPDGEEDDEEMEAEFGAGDDDDEDTYVYMDGGASDTSNDMMDWAETEEPFRSF